MSDHVQDNNLPLYLRDLSDRLMHVPVMYGINGYDIDRLNRFAFELEAIGVVNLPGENL